MACTGSCRRHSCGSWRRVSASPPTWPPRPPETNVHFRSAERDVRASGLVVCELAQFAANCRWEENPVGTKRAMNQAACLPWGQNLVAMWGGHSIKAAASCGEWAEAQTERVCAALLRAFYTHLPTGQAERWGVDLAVEIVPGVKACKSL